MGFTQKETVKILYAICGILGLVAVFMCDKMFDTHSIIRAVMIGIIALAIFIIYMGILKNPKDRINTGLIDEAAVISKEAEKQTSQSENEK